MTNIDSSHTYINPKGIRGSQEYWFHTSSLIGDQNLCQILQPGSNQIDFKIHNIKPGRVAWINAHGIQETQELGRETFMRVVESVTCR